MLLPRLASISGERLFASFVASTSNSGVAGMRSISTIDLPFNEYCTQTRRRVSLIQGVGAYVELRECLPCAPPGIG